MGKFLPVIIIIVTVLVIGLLIIPKKSSNNVTSNPQTSEPQIEAVYAGEVPCADCPGINETITFYQDKTYTDKNVYQEKDVTSVNKGTWSINAEDIFQLTDSESSHSSYYQLKADKLIPLDSDTKKPIEAPFNLSLTRQPL